MFDEHPDTRRRAEPRSPSPQSPPVQPESPVAEGPSAHPPAAPSPEPASRRRIRGRWLALAGAVLLLAVVIFIGSALSSPKESGSESASERSAELVQKAQDAAVREDTAQAQALAQQALDVDPNNRRARELLEGASGPARREPDPNPTPAPPVVDDEPEPTPVVPGSYDVRIDPLGSLLPGAIAGWTRGQVAGTTSDVLVTYEPVATSDAAGRVVRATVTVHDRRTAAAAEKFVERVSKVAFAKDAGSARVNDTSAYFGTDGTRLAAISFSRGRYAFEVVLTTKVAPKNARDDVIAIAKALPATRR